MMVDLFRLSKILILEQFQRFTLNNSNNVVNQCFI